MQGSDIKWDSSYIIKLLVMDFGIMLVLKMGEIMQEFKG